MAINERLIDTEVAAAGNGGAGSGNQEEGLILHLDANDVDSYDGDGSVWYDITNYEYKPAINVSEHFNTVLYNGTGSSVTVDAGFAPDLVWLKRRDSGNDNYTLVDTVRGANSRIFSTITDGELTNGNFSFNSDGTFNTNAVSSQSKLGANHVAWCFKAGGAAVSNTDGATTSQVSANQDLGFSIVKHTGTSSTTSIGHGLGIAPELIITKNTTDSSNWSVSGSVGNLVYGTNKIQLNTTAAATNDYNEVLSANGTTFTAGGSGETNGSGDSIIHYCFASKRGVSKVGSYEGSGAAGNKVYTGFEPAFVMVKATNFTENWIIYDNKRSTDNPRNEILLPNSDLAELSSTNYNIDFDGDGFTINSLQNFVNRNGINYIYYAVAKNTNETSLIPDTNLELHLDAGTYSGSGNWLDSSGNGNNGTITGATWEQELGNSFDFDGSNDIIKNSSLATAFRSQTTLSIEAWFKTSAGTARLTIASFSATGDATTDLWLGFYASTNTLAFRNTNDGANVFDCRDIGGSNLRDGNWHHVVFTADSGGTHIYVDGDEITGYSFNYGSASTNIVMPTDLNQFSIGGNTDSGGDQWFMNGQIGQVRVYDAALTAAQVRQNFNFTKNNYSNGYNGTINGATWNSAGYFQFDGSNDEIDLTAVQPYSSQSNQTNSIKSITGWVKLDTGTRAMLYTISSINSSNDYFSCQIRNDSNGVYMQGRDGGSTNQFTDKATNSAPDSNWHHYVFQIDGDEREIYIDGVKRTLTKDNRGTATDSSWISYPSYLSSVKHRVQKGRESSAYYGTGKISKVKHYTRPLTQAEITALYNEGE